MLLVLLLICYLLSALVHTRWIAGIELVLFAAAGLLAIRNSPMRSPALRLAISIGLIVTVAIIVVSASIDTTAGRGVAAIWTGLLLLATVVVLIRQILLMPTVTIQSIFGAVSAYLIIGLMYASLYSAIYYLHGRQFFAGHEVSTPSTFQYFSFTTLTTLGYGDFTAAQAGGRAVAMIEAMTGQIFLATLVARLVAGFRPAAARAGHQSGEPEPSDQQ